ncbi:MAG: DUF3014 domain-containing protein [Pseudomonadales bacterium]|jgi:hypothetical protein|nr:DUF3014 domain-containing protein [Gammaproteobacteria bacterium]MBP6051881.1 DUF3014 domain-containing protein [Pseudomonadales bacterium]MBK6581899.1 DUF3014 domain-containing protein [Gammaproteobacteria bacterium]MBK7169396.1 DUF3014 domain-containing protein [Gammaproteobacteria bacterium]MBK7520734.1 DUF3014 domain-containing protein [Gammaproteobacteria bacterium]
MKAREDDRLGTYDDGSASRRRPLLFLVIAVLVIGALGLALRALLSSPEPAAVEISNAPAATGTISTLEPRQAAGNSPPPSAATEAAEGAPPLPELEHSDPEVRATLADILPAIAQPSLQADELLRRASIQADGFGHGKLLRDKLPLPAVPGKLMVEQRGDQWFLAPANFARYDALADAAAELDTDALARWFNRYEPLLQEAVSELGNGDRNVRSLLLAGLDLMLAAPTPDAEIELVRPSVFYKFADPALEALPETQKLLIRMGPRNRELVLDRVRRLRASLGG